MSVSPELFRKILIDWYSENKRDLPWRSSNDPYSVWLSEIILQQTRVGQGLPYYLKFIREFPTIHDLANAPIDTVLKLWQGLGYYTRARNLHTAAQYISKDLNGRFPGNYNELIKLNGVGDYTASAIASICFDEPAAVVDGNVYRVLGRLMGIELSIDEHAGKKYYKTVAQELIDPERPGTYNQALMEFGSRFCIPRNPSCPSCIFKNVCVAFQLNRVPDFPRRSKRIPIKKIYYNYFIPLSKDHKTLLIKRTTKGIWHQLYEFPLIETEKEVDLSFWNSNKPYQDLSTHLGIETLAPFQSRSVVHKLSHRHIYAKFWIVELYGDLENGIAINDIENYPVPRLIDKMIPSLICSEQEM